LGNIALAVWESNVELGSASGNHTWRIGGVKVHFLRWFKLYFRFIGQHLKSILEYQSDFIIALIAAMMTQTLGFIFLWVVYQRIPEIKGWEFWEVAFIYAMIFFTEGVASFFFEGTWTISELVNRGELDRYLVRPAPIILQVLGSKVGIHGIGNMFIGGLIIFQSLTHVNLVWSLEKILIVVLLIISAICIRLAMFLASNCIAFWTQSPRNAFPFMIVSIADFAKFPMTIYSLGIQVFITIIVPYAFISFFPAAYIFEKETWSFYGLLSPLIAIYCLFISIIVFRKGLLKYESVGN
jgi:ABC-2 type transport system permease protein